ncbi:MAG: hypothetical protein ACWA5L_11165 [bacterium]
MTVLNDLPIQELRPGVIAKLTKIERLIEHSDSNGIEVAIKEFTKTPMAISTTLPFLEKIFLSHGQIDTLLHYLLAADSAAWNRVSLLGRIGKLAIEYNLFDFYNKIIQQKCSQVSEWKFGQVEYLWNYSLPLLECLFPLKYVGLDIKPDAHRLISQAEMIIPRIRYNEKAFSFLYQNSQYKDLLESEWRHRSKLSFALEHLIADTQMPVADLNQLVDPLAVQKIEQEYDPQCGTVLMLSHAGYVQSRYGFFSQAFPDAIFMTNHKVLENRLEVGEDETASLMLAMKALLNGNTIVISPDGKRGRGESLGSLFGKQITIKDGAALLAYETRSRTAFFTMGRDGGVFIPRLYWGPEVGASESYTSYKQRLAAFYIECLRQHFSGNPDSLLYSGSWMKFFMQ